MHDNSSTFLYHGQSYFNWRAFTLILRFLKPRLQCENQGVVILVCSHYMFSYFSTSVIVTILYSKPIHSAKILLLQFHSGHGVIWCILEPMKQLYGDHRRRCLKFTFSTKTYRCSVASIVSLIGGSLVGEFEPAS